MRADGQPGTPSATTRYWFPAKRYGYGWGPPLTWQGWAVLAVFVALVVAGIVLFPPRVRLLAFVVYEFVVTLGLIAVCYAKGEPPSWRWGDD
ncbi:MAG: hypothetical protein ACM3JC_03540 [Rudaea sp.]